MSGGRTLATTQPDADNVRYDKTLEGRQPRLTWILTVLGSRPPPIAPPAAVRLRLSRTQRRRGRGEINNGAPG